MTYFLQSELQNLKLKLRRASLNVAERCTPELKYPVREHHMPKFLCHSLPLFLMTNRTTQ